MRALGIRSVLVATDLTEASDDVVRAAAAIAALLDAELHVVHSVENAPQYPSFAESVLEMQRRIHDARPALDAEIARAVPSHVPVASRQVAYGSPSSAIRRRADEVGADLVVIGPHRDRPFGARLLGKTADRLVRSLDVPCLVVRGRFELPLERVLVATDLSPASRTALDVALDWASALRREVPAGADAATSLAVIHIAPWFLGGAAYPSERPSMGDLVRDEVEAAARRGEGDLGIAVQSQVIWGDSPADDILHQAASRRPNLLVLGTHGTSALARALIGSVSSAVVREAECPVLLVPPGAEPAAVFAGEQPAAEPHNVLSPAVETW